MRNPYTLLDNALMKGANVAVHAYNWTTGRTKADLANKMLAVAPILDGVGTIPYCPNLGIPFTLVTLFISHFFQKENNRIERLEQDASENFLLSPEVENYREINRDHGPIWLGLGSLIAVPIFQGESFPEKHAMLSLGFGCRAGSTYIMRTDYLPPRKNCVRRGLDRLAEIVEDYRAEPALMPALVGNRFVSD